MQKVSLPSRGIEGTVRANVYYVAEAERQKSLHICERTDAWYAAVSERQMQDGVGRASRRRLSASTPGVRLGHSISISITFYIQVRKCN